MKKKLVLLSALAVLALATLTGCCKHEWADATCKAPKTCSLCGKTEGEVVDHTWTDATCEAPKTCSVCGETEGEALGHQFSEAGYMTPGVCSVCGAEGDVKPNYIDEKGLRAPVTLINGEGEISLPYIIYCADDRDWFETKFCNVNIRTMTEDNGDGTKTETIYVDYPIELKWDYAKNAGLTACTVSVGLADMYTGVTLNSQATEGDDTFETTQIINIDGKDYEFVWGEGIEWDWLGWMGLDGDYDTGINTARATMTVTMPSDYDGLILNVKEYVNNITEEEWEETLAKGIEDKVEYIDEAGDYNQYDANPYTIKLCYQKIM